MTIYNGDLPIEMLLKVQITDSIMGIPVEKADILEEKLGQKNASIFLSRYNLKNGRCDCAVVGVY